MTVLERNELIIKYIPLANKIANKFYSSVFFEEIKSAAYWGLVDAARKFKKDLNCSFFTYAKIRITGEIKDFFRQNKKRKFKLLLDEHEVSNNYFEHYNNIDLLDKLMSFLSITEKKIIKMYYLEDKNMKDIGRLFGLSESRISQLISKFKKNIRKKNENYIGDYPSFYC